MKPWEVLGRARMPDGTALTLTRHPSEFAILADGETLMTSRDHRSESLLGTVGCDRARRLARPYVLIGGLGMGFTLRAALDILPPDARVLVAELSPEVVAWNRGPLGPLANHPLNDPRVRVELGDVTVVLRAHAGKFDAILLDVDNGPLAMSAATNAALYDETGVALARAALGPGGVLAVWSAGHNHRYEERLRAGGLDVRSERVTRHGTRRGGRRQTIILASVATPRLNAPARGSTPRRRSQDGLEHFERSIHLPVVRAGMAPVGAVVAGAISAVTAADAGAALRALSHRRAGIPGAGCLPGHGRRSSARQARRL